jgi:hypothetical protein
MGMRTKQSESSKSSKSSAGVRSPGSSPGRQGQSGKTGKGDKSRKGAKHKKNSKASPVATPTVSRNQAPNNKAQTSTLATVTKPQQQSRTNFGNWKPIISKPKGKTLGAKTRKGKKRERR